VVVVPAVPGQQAGDHQADDAADGQRAGHHGHGHRQPLGGQLAAQDRDGQREQPVGGALQHPGHQQHRQGRRQHRQQRAQADHHEDAEHHPPLAEGVAEAADHRGEHRGGEQVGRQHPPGGAGTHAELLADDREHRHDQRLQQRQRGHAQGQGEHQQPGARGIAGHGTSRFTSVA